MAKGKIRTKERIDFYSFLVTLLESGKNQQEACEEVSAKISEKAKEWGVLAPLIESKGKLYGDVAYGMRKGMSLSKVLSGRIPDNELMMLVAGGQGDMVAALKAAEKEARDGKQMTDTLVKGVVYPSVIFLVLVGVMHWLGTNLFPAFTGLIPVSEWQPRAQTVYWLTTNIHIWFPALLATLAALGAVSMWVHRNVQGPVREQIHWIPPLNVVRAMTGANLLSTLGNLVLAGEPMKESLQRMSSHSTSPYLAHYTRLALEQMRRGDASQGLGAALQMPLFDMWTQIKIDLHGRGDSDDFIANIERIADEAREKAQTKVSLVAQVLNYAMMIAVGVIIIVSILTMISISQEVRNVGGL